MKNIVFSVAEPEALKNIYVADNCEGTVLEVHYNHKSHYCLPFIEHISRIDLGGSYAHHKLLYKEYIWVTVLLPNYCITVFVIDPDLKQVENYREMVGQKVIMRYDSKGGIRVW